MSHSPTPWKKSRTFGDIHGGREHRLRDRMLRHVHSVPRPGPHDDLPIFVRDNPSRDYVHPLNEDDVRRELDHLPKKHWRTLTHIWFRRFKASEYEAGELPLASFMCGSGVRIVVLYPWPRDLRLRFGRRRPRPRALTLYRKYATDLRSSKGVWYLQWTGAALRNFCVEVLLYHEIGHHVDWYHRRWTKANTKPLEEFADQYAYERTSKRSITYRGENE